MSDSHVIFRLGEYVNDSIDLDRSDVDWLTIPGLDVKPRRYTTTKMFDPKITWLRDKVAGRVIWADSKLPEKLAISVELANEFKRRKYKYLEFTEGALI